MKETSLSGKQKKLNRGGSNVNTRFIIQLSAVVIGVALYATIF